jgi:hypothetical protein
MTTDAKLTKYYQLIMTKKFKTSDAFITPPPPPPPPPPTVPIPRALDVSTTHVSLTLCRCALPGAVRGVIVF